MPVYEFLCGNCQRKFRRLVGMTAQSRPLECPQCQSDAVKRQISRFARVRSDDEAIDALGDEMEALGDMDDPAAMRRVVKQMGREMGEDLEDDFDAMMEEESEGNSEENEAG